MSKLKRLGCFLIGMFASGVGVALSTRPGLGTSPISSLPYVTTFAVPWTLGIATVVINIFFIAAQMFLLKKHDSLKVLGQLPTLLVFGFFIDLGMWLTAFYVPENYCLRLLEELLGCAVLAWGISWQLASDISLLPGDGLVRVLAQKFSWPFGTVKICFDSSIVVSAMIFSLIFFQNITGVREGTLIAAVLVGLLIRKIQKLKLVPNLEPAGTGK